MSDKLYSEALSAAEMAFSNREFETALEYYQKALQEKADDIYTLSRAGCTCIALEKNSEAFTYFNRAVEIDPRNGDNYYNLGNAYFFAGEYDKCLDYYTKAEMYGCSNEVKMKMYYQKALLCGARGDVKAALVFLEKYEKLCASDLKSIDPRLFKERVKMYTLIQDFENAELNAAKLVGIQPEVFDNYVLYYSILIMQKKYGSALQIIEDAESFGASAPEEKYQLYQHKAAVLGELASLSAEQIDNPRQYMDMAMQCFETLLAMPQTAGSKVEVKLSLANLYMQKNMLAEAIALVKGILPPAEIVHHEADLTPAGELSDAPESDSFFGDGETSEQSSFFGGTDKPIKKSFFTDDDDEDAPAVKPMKTSFFSAEETVEADDAAEEPEAEKEQEAAADEELSPEVIDRARFILMSCYVADGNFAEAYPLTLILKDNANAQYQYFGKYCEAAAMKQLAGTDPQFTAEAAERKYAEVIAFFRSCMLRNAGDKMAAVLRTRMYAESGSYAKAEELTRLLSADERPALLEYIQKCRETAEHSES